MNLGRTAQGVPVLNPNLPLPGHIPASLQELSQHPGCLQLTPMGTDGMHPLIQRIHNALMGFKAQGCGNICHFHQFQRIKQGQTAGGGHGLGAVDQSQALFCHQFHRWDACQCHSLRAGKALALILGFTQTQHGQHHVGKGCQVAAGAQRAFLGDHRSHTPVEHFDEGLHHLQPGTGVALGQIVHPQKHNAPGCFPGEGFACAHRMGDDQVFLQEFALVLADADIAELAKAGGNAVDRLSFRHQVIHRLAGSEDPFFGLFAQGHRHIMAADDMDVIQGQILAG